MGNYRIYVSASTQKNNVGVGNYGDNIYGGAGRLGGHGVGNNLRSSGGYGVGGHGGFGGDGIVIIRWVITQ